MNIARARKGAVQLIGVGETLREALAGLLQSGARRATCKDCKRGELIELCQTIMGFEPLIDLAEERNQPFNIEGSSWWIRIT